jgi:hypothetical protein
VLRILRREIDMTLGALGCRRCRRSTVVRGTLASWTLDVVANVSAACAFLEPGDESGSVNELRLATSSAVAPLRMRFTGTSSFLPVGESPAQRASRARGVATTPSATPAILAQLVVELGVGGEGTNKAAAHHVASPSPRGTTRLSTTGKPIT